MASHTGHSKMTEHKMTLRIPAKLHKAAKVKATQTDVTLSEVVRQLLGLWVSGEVTIPTDKQKQEEKTKQE